MEYALTPDEIKEIDEITFDNQANDKTLEIAMRYHSNAKNFLLKQEHEWWRKMFLKHNIAPFEKVWSINRKTGQLVLSKEES